MISILWYLHSLQKKRNLMLPDQIDIDLPSRRDCEIELFVIVAVSVTFIVGVIVK